MRIITNTLLAGALFSMAACSGSPSLDEYPSDEVEVTGETATPLTAAERTELQSALLYRLRIRLTTAIDEGAEIRIRNGRMLGRVYVQINRRNGTSYRHYLDADITDFRNNATREWYSTDHFYELGMVGLTRIGDIASVSIGHEGDDTWVMHSYELWANDTSNDALERPRSSPNANEGFLLGRGGRQAMLNRQLRIYNSNQDNAGANITRAALTKATEIRCNGRNFVIPLSQVRGTAERFGAEQVGNLVTAGLPIILRRIEPQRDAYTFYYQSIVGGFEDVTMGVCDNNVTVPRYGDDLRGRVFTALPDWMCANPDRHTVRNDGAITGSAIGMNACR